MTDKIYNAYIVPNRSTPRAFVNVIFYRREGNRVTAWRWHVLYNEHGGIAGEMVEPVAWNQIAPSPTDPEFGRVWMAHVAAQEQVHLTLAQRA